MKHCINSCHKRATRHLPFKLLFFIVFLYSCAFRNQSYNPQQKFAPDELKADVDVLWQTLDKCHPSLDWYTSYDSVSLAFNQLKTAISDSLTEPEFRMKLAQALATIHCGHTSVRISKAAARYRDPKPGPIFPLHIKTWQKDSMVVLSNAFRNDSILSRGSIIHSINGISVNQVIDSVFQFMSADGLHNSFKYQLLSNNFPAWFKSVFGLSPSYNIEVTSTNGVRLNANIKNFFPADADSIRRSNIQLSRTTPPAVKPNKLASLRNLTIDTAKGLAVMELNTFSHSSLPRFFRKSFKKLKELNIRNLAIELRENGGGNIMNSTRLTKYISDHPFKVADTVAAKSLCYPYPGLVKNGFFYKVQNWFVSSRRDDGRLHYRLYERKVFKPQKKNHYDGKVFILTGGFTFSASTLFITPLKGQQNVTVIGEETGGAAIGNTAVNIPDLTLPNSKVRVRIPLYRLVTSNKIPHDGRGVIPDIVVPPTSFHLRYRLDPKMMKVYELISNKTASN